MIYLISGFLFCGIWGVDIMILINYNNKKQ